MSKILLSDWCLKNNIVRQRAHVMLHGVQQKKNGKIYHVKPAIPPECWEYRRGRIWIEEDYKP